MTADRPLIGVIIASNRAERFADHVIGWLTQQLTIRADLDIDLIDVREVALPFYDLPVPPAKAHRVYRSDTEQRLGARLEAAEGYLILTNEYNHGYSAALKNVLDHFFIEFVHKPVALVGYGNVGGARAIEQLRNVIAELDMVSVRETVNILGHQFAPIRDGGVNARHVFETLNPKLTVMTDNLLWWSRALTSARSR